MGNVINTTELNQINDLNNTSDSKIAEIKDKSVKFLKKHKNKILFVSGIGISILVTTLTVDNIKQRKNLEVLSDTIVKQKSKIKCLYELNNSKNKWIETLENLCLKKDDFFKKFISDGTKRGDSECARQLAYRKQVVSGNI